MSLIAPKPYCIHHQNYQIIILNLSIDRTEDKRLYCVRCNLQQQLNLYCLEDILDFLIAVQKSEEDLIALIQQDKIIFSQFKDYIIQIQKRLQNLQNEHLQLLDSVIKNQKIKPNDQIETFLQKKQQCDINELIKMAESTSKIQNRMYQIKKDSFQDFVDIHLWTKQNQQREKTQILNKSKKQLLYLSFNSDDTHLAAGSSDCRIYVYFLQDGQYKLKTKIQDQSQEINFIKYLNSQNLLSLLKRQYFELL